MMTPEERAADIVSDVQLVDNDNRQAILVRIDLKREIATAIREAEHAARLEGARAAVAWSFGEDAKDHSDIINKYAADIVARLEKGER